MSDHLKDVEQTLAQLTKNSRVSVTMLILSATLLLGSVIYSATRLTPLEEEVAAKKNEITALIETKRQTEAEIAAAKQKLDNLRGSIEDLNAVKVTAKDKIFELRASARATGRMGSQGPAYNFSVFINAAPSTIDSIESVTYLFDHPTFGDQNTMISTDRSNNFKVGYLGWGCLTNVSAEVQFESNEQSEIEFNMCQSLGTQWWNEEAIEDPAISEIGEDIVGKITKKRTINKKAFGANSPIQKMAPSSNRSVEKRAPGKITKKPARKITKKRAVNEESFDANGPVQKMAPGSNRGVEKRAPE